MLHSSDTICGWTAQDKTEGTVSLDGRHLPETGREGYITECWTCSILPVLEPRNLAAVPGSVGALAQAGTALNS